MRNAASDTGETSADRRRDMTTHMRVIAADSLQVTALMIAPAEGQIRFIASSPAMTTEARRGIPDALARLASQCGDTLATDMTSAAVVSGPPIAMQVIGAPRAEDAAAIEMATRFGIAKSTAAPLTPPRNPARHQSWFQPALNAWRDGRSEALLVIVPPGALPQWAAQFFNTLGDVAPPPGGNCLVLASDADLAAALPNDIILIPRGDHLAARLAATLNRLRAASALPGLDDDTPLFAHTEALSAAVRAISARHRKPCIYLEVADGTTLIVADGDEAAVYHDPDHDYSRGAVRLVGRREPAELMRWMPFALDTALLRRWTMRRASWPMAFLTEPEDRAIAAALARACLIPAVERITHRLPNEAVWVLGPALTRLGSPAAALGIVADLMDSPHVAVVACDSDDLLPAIGALTLTYPGITADILFHDAVVPVGSVVRASFGHARERGRTSVRLTDGKEGTHTLDVTRNALTTIAGQGPMTLRFAERELPGGVISIEGGAGGILIDTRRRPLTAGAPDPTRPNVSNRLRALAANGGIADEQRREFPRVP